MVPVVRLTGVIGISTPARGLDACQCGAFARSRLRHAQHPRGRAFDQLARRRRRAIPPHPPAHPCARRREEDSGDRLRRGRRGVRRLHDCAADEIVADASSIVGSIGVVGGSFGFSKLIEKIGVERRLYTAGEHKAMLDPFLPEKPEDVEWVKRQLRAETT